MTKAQKKAKRDQHISNQEALIAKAKAENARALTDEEQRAFSADQAEIDTLTREIDDMERNEGQSRSTSEIQAAERSRIAEISSLCREIGMEDTAFVRDGNSIEEVRAAAIEHMKRTYAPVPTGVTVTQDEGDKFRAAAADALILRSGMQLSNPTPGAREMMGMSLRDLAIETMGKDVAQANYKSSDELFNLACRQFYNPTAAFPSILDAAINKSYVEGHKNVAVTFDQWTKKGSLKDFKTVENRYLSGPAGEFLEVPEGGELKHDLPTDEKLPQRKLKTFGRQFTMSRQAFINDDIGFVTTIPAKYAAAARKTQNNQVYSILMNNPAIYDGKPLFHADHKNLITTGTAVTAAAIQKMFMALQTQKNEFGEAIIIRPATIVVPVGYAMDMYQILESPTINTTGNTQAANPLHRYKTMLNIVEDPTINALAAANAMPWFVIGDPGDSDFIEVDYLNGQEVPTIRRMEAPGTLGFIWDIYLDWGITAMDFRGGVKNPGVPMDFTL